MFNFHLSTRITAAALSIVVFAGAMLMIAENARIRDIFMSERSDDLREAISDESIRLSQAIAAIRGDAVFLSNTPPISGIARAALNHGYDAREGTTREKWETRMQQILTAFLLVHPDYYMVRYIGVADGGREIVRVENRGGVSRIKSTPPTNLHQKTDMDYFKEALALHEGQSYLSRFEFMQENGVIDLPYTPALHAVAPVFSPTGLIFGVVVINMDVSKLFKYTTLGLPPGAQSYIADMDGQYVWHTDSRQTLTYKMGKKDSLSAEFPFLKTMLNPQAADYLPMQAVATNQGRQYMAVKRVHFDIGDPSRFLLLAYGIPSAVLAGQSPTIPVKHIVGILIAMLLISWIALIILRRTFAPLANITEAANRISAGDCDTLLTQAGGGEIGSLTSALNTMLARLTQREESLRNSFNEVEDLYNNVPCGYHSLDKDGIIRRINDTELVWIGYTRDEVIGKMKLTDLLTLAGGQVFHEAFQQLKKLGVSNDIELEIICKDGSIFTGLINTTAIYDTNGNFVMTRSSVTDITARKQVESKLRNLAAHLQTVREEEKAVIAREIHDDLGGTLLTLKMEAHWLKTELLARKEATQLLGHVWEMSKAIDHASGIMRNIITGLRPTILDELGLLAALEWQATQFQKRTGIKCRINCIGDKGDLDKLRSIELFRISQEALANVVKHSGASSVEIEFHHSDEEVVMSIIDNGCGLTEKRADASIHYGILGMTERVDQLGGRISFASPPSGGFNVTVILPLLAKEDEKT